MKKLKLIKVQGKAKARQALLIDLDIHSDTELWGVWSFMRSLQIPPHLGRFLHGFKNTYNTNEFCYFQGKKCLTGSASHLTDADRQQNPVQMECWIFPTAGLILSLPFLFFITSTSQKSIDQPALHPFPSRALQLCQQFPVRALQIPRSTSDALVNPDIWSNASCAFISDPCSFQTNWKVQGSCSEYFVTKPLLWQEQLSIALDFPMPWKTWIIQPVGFL